MTVEDVANELFTWEMTEEILGDDEVQIVDPSSQQKRQKRQIPGEERVTLNEWNTDDEEERQTRMVAANGTRQSAEEPPTISVAQIPVTEQTASRQSATNSQQPSVVIQNPTVPPTQPVQTNQQAQGSSWFSGFSHQQPLQTSACSFCGSIFHTLSQCPDFKCGICGRNGHTPSNCPRNLPICSRCSKPGHTAEECRQDLVCDWCKLRDTGRQNAASD
jgi:hypothetical protein